LGPYGVTHRWHRSRISSAIPLGKGLEKQIRWRRRSPLKSESFQGCLADLRPGGSLGELERYSTRLKRIDQGVMAQNRMSGSEGLGCAEEKRWREVWLAKGVPEVTIETLSLSPFKRTAQERSRLAQQRLGIADIPRQECRLCREKEASRLSVWIGCQACRPGEK
jgi:hypothetical protein